MSCRCGYREDLLRRFSAYNEKNVTYLDYNATSPVDTAVLGAFERSCRKLWAHPSSLHSAGISAWEDVEKSRKILAEYFSWPTEGIYFTSSGTAGIEIILHHLLRSDTVDTILTSSVEHRALYHPLRIFRMAGTGDKENGRKRIVILPVDSRGQIVTAELEKTLRTAGRCALLYSPVNHETGALQDTVGLHRQVMRSGGLVYIDAVQAAARLLPEEWTAFCDGFVISAHKLYAPKGIGALFLNPSFRLREGLLTGYTSGTPNTPGIAALGEAVSLLRVGEDRMTQQALVQDFRYLMEQAEIGYTILSPETSVPGVLCFYVNGIRDMENFFSFLYSQDICISRFSACTSQISGPSRVLKALGVSDTACRASLRMSLGRYSRRKDIISFISAMGKYLRS